MVKINIKELKKRAIKVTEVDYNEINNNYLKNLRNSLNMSQSLFASYLGVSKKSIEKWEQGGIYKISQPVKRLLLLINDDPSILSKMRMIEFADKKCEYTKSIADFSEDVSANWNISNDTSNEGLEIRKAEKRYGYCL